MSLGENHSESSIDHNGHSADGKEESGVRGAYSSPDHSQENQEKQCDHSDDAFLSGQRDTIQLGAHPETRGGSVRIWIKNMNHLRKAIELGCLSQVTYIDIYQQDIGNGHFTLAGALGSGQMSALKQLWLWSSGLEGDWSEAIGNALHSGEFPSLIRIHIGHNNLGTKGVEALGLAIRSGNLKVDELGLSETGISDDDMATLAIAFRHGQTSVLPYLRSLSLDRNGFTDVGLQYLAEALQSGRLDSLEKLYLNNLFSKPSRKGASALVSAFDFNIRLTTVVHFDWHRFPDLGRRYRQLRKRNLKNKDILEGLVDSPMVPAAVGKVYLCGNPKVGKTTLSHTLQRGFWEALLTWQRKSNVEERTRGIEVSQVSSKVTKKNPITLLVWDMAGQQDYHLVHNAFFPDLSFSEGKATTFVIVCNSKNLNQAQQQLQYWLQYIASSCHKTTPRLRHVFVVLNNFEGDKQVQGYGHDWQHMLEDQKVLFEGLLNVFTDPFVIDVRRRVKVSGLKTCLLEHSKNLLHDQKVPEMCQIIEQHLLAWSEGKKEFPVLDWEEFVQQVGRCIAPWPEKIIEAATKYLNEAGVLIYIIKKFPSQWGIPDLRLVVLDVNWFCNQIVGNMFLSKDMVNQNEHQFLFRNRVDETTGSISIADFKKFFKSRWNDKEFQNLIAILLWLGLCYKGKGENVFIPSLIDINGILGDPWQSQGQYEDEEEQWVMGFSIEHKKCEMTLAPISLWHRFQVQLAQTPKFNGEVADNDFVAGKYFATFSVDYMNVRIEVNAEKGSPTFDEISIYVKPKFRKDEMDVVTRKQCQVNLADDILDVLMGLWNDTCGRVEFVHKVVWPWPVSESWPWPVSQSRPVYKPDRNVEVAQVKDWVQLHGMGRRMQWTVGHDSAITEDQLLSTKDKRNVILSAEDDVNILRVRMQEAVALKIFPPELTNESKLTLDMGEVATQHTNVLLDGISCQESVVASKGFKEGTELPLPRILKAFEEMGSKVDQVGEKVDKVSQKLNDVEIMLRQGFKKVYMEERKVLRKLQETERFFKEDKDRTCPNLIYLGERDSGVWATLKEALSPTVHVCLRFACEAMYNNYRPHEVKDQQGLDVSALKSSLKKIAPWLKVSLSIILICAKIGTNLVAPGAGLILPNLRQLQQANSLLDGIVWATGFSKDELDKLLTEDMGLDAKDASGDASWNPRNVYGKSRAAITALIGKLTPETYAEEFGLRKVCLAYKDGSLHGIVWICTNCHQKFKEANLASDI